MPRLEASHLLVNSSAALGFGGGVSRTGIGFVFTTMAAPIGNLLESYFYLRQGQAGEFDYDFDMVSKLWTVAGDPIVANMLLATSVPVNAESLGPFAFFPNLPDSRIQFAFEGEQQVPLLPETQYAITVEAEEDDSTGKASMDIASQNPQEANGNEIQEIPKLSGTWVVGLANHARCFEVWSTDAVLVGGGGTGVTGISGITNI